MHQQVHFLWPPLSYRNEQTLLGASSQPLRATDRLPSPDAARPPRASAGQQPRRALGGTLVRPELRSRPPARLLSCGAVTAPTPHSPGDGEAAGGHFLPRRPPRAPLRSHRRSRRRAAEPTRATSAGGGTAGAALLGKPPALSSRPCGTRNERR